MPESRISRPPSYFQGPQILSAHQAPPSYQAIYANPEERLPQSFLEKGLPVNIDYELAVRVKHGLFRPDTKLKAPIVFIPEITPELASPRRQVAYTEGVFQLPSPISDPEGWFAVELCTISGRLDSNLEVDVQCMHHLARPLCYTRGTVIPCYMTLLCRNSDALERLSKPESQRVFLTRRVTYFKNVMKDIERHVVGKKITPLEHTDVVEVADLYGKVLEGEVHLSQALVPSSTFLAFCVQYTVDIRLFNSPEFKPASTSSPGLSTTQSAITVGDV
ncbi:hypothetical protein BJ165DRAFT_1521498 [Panaeolus papilionaceus]|nr:hypothetical protein BJ165DRAFT_1521498 [Panaeolus papilionaceus]